ncbi:MAG TPA: PilZ domain-containing protein, partial [Candidatus Dormibacteraeota bacterium]|nr:PilZ domain-containing protein [Candidatus Dormibacteraeota bacterium]
MQRDFSKESGESIFPTVPPPALAITGNLRRSERVLLNLPVRVSVMLERGEDFLGEGQTVDVSHNGAAITVNRDLLVGQTVKVRRVEGNKEAVARVVGCYKDPSANSPVFGITLTESSDNFWDIVFPTNVGPDKAVLRALLRCVACGRLEVSYLNEFESDLFLNHHSVARLCEQCGGWTTWTRPYGIVAAGS